MESASGNFTTVAPGVGEGVRSPTMIVSIASARRASNTSLRQVGDRVAGEALPVALLARVLRHEGERRRPVQPQRVHEVDPALRGRTFGVDQPDVREHERADHVADGRRLRRAPQRVERGAAARREVARPSGDHRADQAVAGTEVVVDGGAVLAGGIGDVAHRHAEALGEEELLGDVEELGLRARRRGPIGLQAGHHEGPFRSGVPAIRPRLRFMSITRVHSAPASRPSGHASASCPS